MKAIVLPMTALLLPCLACPMDDDEDTSAATAASTAASTDDPSTSSPTSSGAATTSGDATATSGDATATSGSEDTTPASTSGEGGASDEGSATTGAATYTLSGTVALADGLELVGDGVGNLYIGAFTTCGEGPSLVGVAFVPGADVSGGKTVAFAIHDLAPGPVQLAYFLDDDADADPANPTPDAGDPAYAEGPCDGIVSCVGFEIVDADITDAALELVENHPDCTGG